MFEAGFTYILNKSLMNTRTKKKTILKNRLFQFYSHYGELYCFAVILCFAQCYSLCEFMANKISLNP